MRRTKPTKKEQDMIDNNIPHKECGGHMPYPPKDCPAPKIHISSSGTRYVDNLFCERCPQRASCRRYIEFKKEWKIYHRTVQAIKSRCKKKEEEEK